jgi:CheY-like chemotaxis protein/anti-sigma regulatory factor (Ser/Thr protein kinase)
MRGGAVDSALLLSRLKEARHGGERVATIVRDLKTLAREDQAVHWPVQLDAVLEAAINTVGKHLTERGRITRDYRDVPVVEGIAARLEQVFVNLLSNAAQALPEGDPERNEVAIRVEEDGEFVRVMVKDTGSGMSDEIKRRIFDPFFTTKPAGVGTGLGLPICQGIVAAHGGSLDVTSAPGQGSTFTVKLRLFQGEASLTQSDAPPPHSSRGRILIVDDDVAVGRTLRLALEEDHEITVVGSGSEALEALRSAPPGSSYDAILCDLLMPGMTGRELFAIAREELPDVARRFIFMSGGYWAEGDQAPLSTHPVLEKPFNLDQVRKVLRDVVGRSQSQAPAAAPNA